MKDNKNVLIIGDSYSTYGGYNPEGYRVYYSDERVDAPIVRGVEKTWWGRLAGECCLNIVVNDSFSGSTVCNSVRGGDPISSSFVSRLDAYIAENLFEERDINTLLIFGGTNDCWTGAPLGKLKYSDWTTDDLNCLFPAFCYLLSRGKKVCDNVIAIINTELTDEIHDGFIAACEHIGVRYVCLKDIDKENGHPTELGMEQIAKQVMAHLQEK